MRREVAEAAEEAGGREGATAGMRGGAGAAALLEAQPMRWGRRKGGMSRRRSPSAGGGAGGGRKEGSSWGWKKGGQHRLRPTTRREADGMGRCAQALVAARAWWWATVIDSRSTAARRVNPGRSVGRCTAGLGPSPRRSSPGHGGTLQAARGRCFATDRCALSPARGHGQRHPRIAAV